jgi:hypothetical protein
MGFLESCCVLWEDIFALTGVCFFEQIAKARLTAKQIDGLDKDMREHNLRMLNSITDVRHSA